jgi:hypothetical protein
MKAIDIGLIQARRTKLVAEIESHQQEIAALAAKLSELDIAERVFAELSLESDSTESTPVVTANFSIPVREDACDQPDDRHENASEISSGKPDGIPAISEMILEALSHAHGLGAPGLKPKGLTSYIRGRYWPNAPAVAVGPIAWRMFKRGQLSKIGSTYVLPSTDDITGSHSDERSDLESGSSNDSLHGKEPLLFRRTDHNGISPATM